METKKDITGRKSGRLTAIKFAYTKNQTRYWLFQCVCGGIITVPPSRVFGGKTQSCGCLWKEKIIESITTHKMSKTRIYKIWSLMKNRVLNKNATQYKWYGGRGITIYKKWLYFENFFADMGKTYKEGLTLERKDVNGGYTPKNCCWILPELQARNTRTVVKYQGETLAEASRRLGGNHGLASGRIKNLGWSLEKAFTTPVSKNKNYALR